MCDPPMVLPFDHHVPLVLSSTIVRFCAFQQWLIQFHGPLMFKPSHRWHALIHDLVICYPTVVNAVLWFGYNSGVVSAVLWFGFE